MLCVSMKILSDASAKKKTETVKGFKFGTFICRFRLKREFLSQCHVTGQLLSQCHVTGQLLSQCHVTGQVLVLSQCNNTSKSNNKNNKTRTQCNNTSKSNNKNNKTRTQ